MDTNDSKRIDGLCVEIRAVLEKARSSAYRAVNLAMVSAYWQIGHLIVEYEQEGKERAEYGKALLDDLAGRLTKEYGKGYSTQGLRNMRQFYLVFSKRAAVRSESSEVADRVACENLAKCSAVRSELTWTHYKILMRVENDKAREWYMDEAADLGWSTRQLERQISTLYYERLMASRQKEPVKQEAVEKLARVEPEHFIRDPYVLEFLNLKDYPGLRETVVEQAIIDKLQQFLLELGRGFSFVARQKRMRFDDKDFYVDLVFYNSSSICRPKKSLYASLNRNGDRSRKNISNRIRNSRKLCDESNSAKKVPNRLSFIIAICDSYFLIQNWSNHVENRRRRKTEMRLRQFR